LHGAGNLISALSPDDDPISDHARNAIQWPLFNGHSMVDRLVRVLVCSPRAAGWDQPSRLARWQELGFLHPPDFQKAQAQHDVLCRELRAAGAEVVELPPNQQATLDAVFAHDATLPTDFGLILMRPGKANRETEGRYQSSAADPNAR
jgi:N-dimethylarginine dimethylaminohydrolase